MAEHSIEATRIQYTAGKASQKDVLQAGVTYSQLAGHLIMFEREADSSRAELNTLMGRPPDRALEISGDYGIIETLPSQDELQSLALRNRPELQALEAMKKQGIHKVKLAEKGRSPDYSISAGYMLMPTGSMNRNGWLAEFTMSLPWLSRSKHDTEILQAQEEFAPLIRPQKATGSNSERDPGSVDPSGVLAKDRGVIPGYTPAGHPERVESGYCRLPDESGQSP